MAFLRSECPSITGKWLYSDYYCGIHNHDSENKIPFLNNWATYPVVGMAAGVARCGLAIIHTVGHLFAALITWNPDHLPHVVKGCAEFGRGIIESIPIIGRIFAIAMTSAGPIPSWFVFGCPCCRGLKELYSFFLIKIYDPNNLDGIDRAVINQGFVTEQALKNHTSGFLPLKPQAAI